MGWSKIKLLINTVRFLKFKQIVFQIINSIKKLSIFNFKYDNFYFSFSTLNWSDVIYNLDTYNGKLNFIFINIRYSFTDKIDWNYLNINKLWLYNLSYFDFLNQKEISKEEGLFLINSFIDNYSNLKDAKESYPTSLRIINVIKFISKNQIYNASVLRLIREDANRLYYNVEFHLFGNHLLENGFALWFASKLFNDNEYLKISTNILTTELNEQIHDDGGHSELSPMYHTLMLYRILDCINLTQLNPVVADNDLVRLFEKKASLMVSWLKNMTFNDGSFPLFNDSSNGINPSPSSVIEYAKKIGVKNIKIPLSDSGYRVFEKGKYKLIADVGQIGCSYQPAHSHADTFNFELHVHDLPFIVDRGISTYEKGKIRSEQRSTKAHNTVIVNELDSSQVWSAFRVANRANVNILNDDTQELEASHNGYLNIGIVHNRRWKFDHNKILIYDKLNESCEAKLSLHFHPSIKVYLKNNILIINEDVTICFENFDEIEILNYYYNPEFNKSILAQKVEVSFSKSLKTIIIID